MASVPPTSASVMADQPFVVGPGISPVMVKLVLQIIAIKHVDLCDLLPTIRARNCDSLVANATKN